MTTDNYKDNPDYEQDPQGKKLPSDNTSRARNQTVMLTPEVTGQVRALLNKNSGSSGGMGVSDPLSKLLPPMASNSWNESSIETNPNPSPLEQPLPSRGKSVTTIYSQEMLRENTSQHSTMEREPMPTSGFSIPEQSQARPAAPVAPSFSVNLDAQRNPASIQATQEVVRKSKIIGFLVSFDKEENGEVFEIGAGRWLITCRPTEHGDYILIQDESISPLHAIIRATLDGSVQVLDQLSEYGTGVTRPGEEEEDVTGGLISVEHGYVIRFGQRSFVLCLVPKVDEIIDHSRDESEEIE